MFHYRWHGPQDAENAASLLPLSAVDVSMPSDIHRQIKDSFKARQSGRLYVVGSNETTAAVIDASYRRFLTAMEMHLAEQNFMLGKRPSAADFALYGQLRQLVGFDPTPREIAHQLSPRTVAWVDLMHDQCGLEPTEQDWIRLEDQPDSLRGLLNEIGRMYVPAQLANAKAVAAGEKRWECEIDGAQWTQQSFPYQAKCLRWTNERYRGLSESDRKRVDVVLDGTGIELMLAK
jgi:hypothetical protein